MKVQTTDRINCDILIGAESLTPWVCEAVMQTLVLVYILWLQAHLI